MKSLKVIVPAIALVIIGFFFRFSINVEGPTPSTASVSQSSEYHGTSTSGLLNGSSTAAANSKLIQTGQITFGSITIASTSNKALVIKNATSTADAASTTVITIPASAPAGTYTFDIILDRGMSIDFPTGFFADYMITFR